MPQLDEARLAELTELFGTEDLSMVVEAFLEEAERAVAGLAELVSDGADPVREHQLHYLVGAARNLGASEFADRCRAFQGAAGGFGATDCDALRVAFRETRVALTNRLLGRVSSAA